MDTTKQTTIKRPRLEIDVQTLPAIPLRYYNGWNVEFNIEDESFQSPILGLSGFSCVGDLERGIDRVIEARKRGI